MNWNRLKNAGKVRALQKYKSRKYSIKREKCTNKWKRSPGQTEDELDTSASRTKKEGYYSTNSKSKTWREYLEERFADDRGEIPQMNSTEGPLILKEEVRRFRWNRQLCNKIYNSLYILEDMKKSPFIPLPKKPKGVNCTDFRIISLMSYVTIIILTIIMYRNSAAIDREICENHSGFKING